MHQPSGHPRTPPGLWLVPNALTLLRILAIPFFAIAVWYGHLWHALVLFVAAGLTDLLDGWIARAFNQRSRLGAILDPAADKLLMTTAFILMALPKDHLRLPIPAWVAILAISRDVVISLVALVAWVKDERLDQRPSLLGKVTTGARGGRELQVSYSTGQRKIVVPPKVPVVQITNGDRSLVKTGAKVFLVAFPKPGGGGEITGAVAVGEKGAAPPM